MIKVGDKAPAFALQADDGSLVTLDSLKGMKAVLFFYPKDNTAG
jgi:thioredoxin-dependent peroxiredoxin